MEICRLCLINIDVSCAVNIFADDSDMLEYKICTCLPVSVLPNDHMPNNVCQMCYEKVNAFYEFWNLTLKSERYLMTILRNEMICQNISMEQANDNIVSVPSIIDRNKMKEPFKSKKTSKSLDTVESSTEYQNVEMITPDIPGSMNNIELRTWGCIFPASENSKKENLPNQISVIDSCRIANGHMVSSYDNHGVIRCNVNNGQIPPGSVSSTEVKSEILESPCSNLNNEKEDYSITSTKQSFQEIDREYKTSNTSKETTPIESPKRVVKFCCIKCDFSTQIKVCYDSHVKKHLQQYNVFCDDCGKAFSNNIELKAHEIKFHAVDPFQCAICNDVFTAKGNLSSHIKSHDSSNSYICEFCGKSYKKKESFRRHKSRSHLGITTKAQCDICKKILSSKDHVRRHMLTHTKERNWVCASCGKCFLSKTYLTEHSRIHTGLRPYKCDICEKSFTQRGSLNIHLRSHTGERPFTCQFCDKGFVMGTLLRYHLKKCSNAVYHSDKISSSEKSDHHNQCVLTSTSNHSLKKGTRDTSEASFTTSIINCVPSPTEHCKHKVSFLS